MLIVFESTEKPGESLLRQIFGTAGIPGMQMAVPQDCRIVFSDKILDRLLITVFHTVQKQKIGIHVFPPFFVLKSAFT